MAAVKHLQDKVIIVTGAASERGIGNATAHQIAKEGAVVIVTDIERNQHQITTVVDEIRNNGGKAFGVVMDVTSQDDIDRMISEVISKYKRIDGIFNNAGTPIGVGDFLMLDENIWKTTFDVNVLGMQRLCKSLVPHFLEQGKGVIVNNASSAGLGGLPEFSAYGASKFAVVGLTKHLAAEFGPKNIRINCVCPGMIDTSMSDIEVNAFMEEHGLDKEEAIRQLTEIVPQRRYGQPEEIAKAVVFLLSDQASYVNGVALSVDGGLPVGT
ncbi:SDR family oxidoreductase [Flammeovirga sp. MY04]|uniref:SDR family NAD(P)-dependent oxidoreductase n=1 Tax=Flammeovirga sp. MY04 TaxID=1191459 RepID=UPI00080633A8|nr:SDR family oxidoreductase [Flammeovirga sp. MY04]ANQ48849.1 SDR family oxidoreductase [Flammeovirga sp. MY04]